MNQRRNMYQFQRSYTASLFVIPTTCLSTCRIYPNKPKLCISARLTWATSHISFTTLITTCSWASFFSFDGFIYSFSKSLKRSLNVVVRALTNGEGVDGHAINFYESKLWRKKKIFLFLLITRSTLIRTGMILIKV